MALICLGNCGGTILNHSSMRCPEKMVAVPRTVCRQDHAVSLQCVPLVVYRIYCWICRILHRWTIEPTAARFVGSHFFRGFTSFGTQPFGEIHYGEIDWLSCALRIQNVHMAADWPACAGWENVFFLLSFLCRVHIFSFVIFFPRQFRDGREGEAPL